MSSTPFATSERALRLKRRSFSKEINEILNESKSDVGLSKANFENKKDYFNEHWENIVTGTSKEDCIIMLDDDYENKEKEITELNYQLELLKERLKQFLDSEVKIEKKNYQILK